MPWPSELRGSDPLHPWLNDLLREARANQLRDSADIITRRDPSGTFANFRASSGPQLKLHPFEIYQFPRNLRKYKNDDDWRRFKVHGGAVMGPQASAGDNIYGTDGATTLGGGISHEAYADPYGLWGSSQVAPNSSAAIVPGTLDAFGGWNEILVPEGELYQVWISLIAVSDGVIHPSICYGTDEANAVNLATGDSFSDAWPNGTSVGAAGNDPYHFYIGSIYIPDTADLPTWNNRRVIVSQVLMDHVYPDDYGTVTSSYPVRERFRGTYDGSEDYWIGDTVLRTVTTAGKNWLKKFIYYPASTSAYHPNTLFAPLTGVDPSTASPDPWILQSASPTDADYTTGAYDATKYYLRTA